MTKQGFATTQQTRWDKYYGELYQLKLRTEKEWRQKHGMPYPHKNNRPANVCPHCGRSGHQETIGSLVAETLVFLGDGGGTLMAGRLSGADEVEWDCVELSINGTVT